MDMFKDYKATLVFALGTLLIGIMTGDIMCLFFFPLWYYLSLINFNREYGENNEQRN